MKINAPKLSSAKRGNVLIITLVFFGIVALSTAGYLTLAHSRVVMRARNLAWNTALPLAEAGVEEAMAHLSDDSDPGTNGWTQGTISGQTVYSKQRTLSDGSYYSITVYNVSTNSPYIYSTGFLPAPLQTTGYISRTVKVTCTNLSLINVAFAAINGINMNGNGVAADSFNSDDPNFSTNGQYDSSKAATNGSVASVYGPVSLGNHSISGSSYLGANASSSVTPSQVSGTIYSNFSISFPDVGLPAGLAPGTAQPAPFNLLSQSHDFTTSGDYYVNDSLNVIIEPGVKVRLRVDTTSFSPGSVSILSTANADSGTLKVYQVAGSVSLGGNVSVAAGKARDFYYFGLPGVTSVTLSGNSSFIGVIYAPEASLTLNGGGNNNGLIGSSITKSITMNGHYNFHFDQDLLTNGPWGTPTPTGWQEL